MKAFSQILSRDLRLALRQRGDAAMVLLFFILIASLFPFGVGPEPKLLARIGAGVVWVSALLAMLLSLERLFLADYEDGSLELMMLAPLPLEAVVLAKALAHWLTSGLPLVLAAPVIGLIYNIDQTGYLPLVTALLLGTPPLSLLGAIGAALTLGARRGGILIPLLILPLAIPVLIFGILGVEAALGGFAARPFLLLQGALLLAALPLAPIAAAAALRQSLE
ncbi:heme exporter protein CcmB [Limibacillus sp. MBR-115]|uniref:heme exporter protein CcmB n=1 Tax=Limibacillus sp. MBR-115 TaxID=3156465 RepID=UPI003392670C